ncbi:MAG: hypothetical protein PHX68_01350 [Alphaproteobacteria bacterium]|nr:hypothetical protein [Alphaproteobacteria bacterium]
MIRKPLCIAAACLCAFAAAAQESALESELSGLRALKSPLMNAMMATSLERIQTQGVESQIEYSNAIDISQSKVQIQKSAASLTQKTMPPLTEPIPPDFEKQLNRVISQSLERRRNTGPSVGKRSYAVKLQHF